VLVAIVMNAAVCAGLRLVARHTWVAWLPLASWLAVALLFGSPRPEGDLIITGSTAGLLFIVLGIISAAAGVTLPEVFRRSRGRGAKRSP
jgi:hypothetical protein